MAEERHVHPRVSFLTAADSPGADDETPHVVAALAELGIPAAMVPWTGPLPDSTELTVIRSTWDYTPRLAEFLVALSAVGAPVLNPIDVVQWNSHKGYLVELASAGLPVVPTTVVRPGEAADFPAGPVVIKPAISASARGTERFDGADDNAQAHLDRLLLRGDALIQPFRPAVIDGEISLIYLDRHFSHAVRKVPASGDYRTQPHLGAVSAAADASAAERAAGQAILDYVVGDVLYARIDLVDSADGPQLMELELIEPYLYLLDSPGSAAAFARAVAARLS